MPQVIAMLLARVQRCGSRNAPDTPTLLHTLRSERSREPCVTDVLTHSLCGAWTAVWLLMRVRWQAQQIAIAARAQPLQDTHAKCLEAAERAGALAFALSTHTINVSHVVMSANTTNVTPKAAR